MSASGVYPAGTYVVRIGVSEGHKIGPGQMLCRVADGLNGRTAPHPLPYDAIEVTFELEGSGELRDLRRRIDRTLDYTDSLLRVPGLSADLVRVLRAVHESLCTAVRTDES